MAKVQGDKGSEQGPDGQGSAVRGPAPYQRPSLVKYGGLAELVQLRPNRGADGEARWIDCTLS